VGYIIDGGIASSLFFYHLLLHHQQLAVLVTDVMLVPRGWGRHSAEHILTHTNVDLEK
jgi:hypothetical protein